MKAKTINKIKDFKIFENSNLHQAYKDCLAEGFVPATPQEINKLINEKIPNQWYDTGLFLIRNTFEVREATKEEIINGSNLSGVYLNINSVISSYDNDLAGSNSTGRVVGVKR